MEKGVALNLGATTAGVVDVVALHGDHVGVAIQVDSPVVVGIAGGGPFADTVDVVVRESDAVVSGGAQHVVLTTDASSLEN